jgi:hypothetical protein
MDGDAEVTFVKVSRSMEKSPSTSKEAAPVHDGSCAAGDLFVETCKFKVCDTNDEICNMCNRHVLHSVCMVMDDTKSGCLKCYGFDEV